MRAHLLDEVPVTDAQRDLQRRLEMTAGRDGPSQVSGDLAEVHADLGVVWVQGPGLLEADLRRLYLSELAMQGGLADQRLGGPHALCRQAAIGGHGRLQKPLPVERLGLGEVRGRSGACFLQALEVAGRRWVARSGERIRRRRALAAQPS